MKWSMIQLKKYRNQGLEINEVVNLDSIKNRDPQIRSVSPIKVTGTADIDSSKVTFHLHITGELILPSSRTLEDVRFPIDIHSLETFLYDDSNYDENTEEETHLIQGELIDLKPVIEELILLEIPMQVYNEEETDQIPSSLQSGKDWEFIREQDLKNNEKIDPRLAELAKLLKREE